VHGGAFREPRHLSNSIDDRARTGTPLATLAYCIRTCAG
jgi:hypothetical protein